MNELQDFGSTSSGPKRRSDARMMKYKMRDPLNVFGNEGV
jgi:hypothetical protein